MFAALLFALPLSAQIQPKQFYVNNASGIRWYIEDSHQSGSTDISIDSLTRNIDIVRVIVTKPSGHSETFVVDFRDLKGPSKNRVISTIPIGIQDWQKVRLEIHRLPETADFE